jgi:hypothetical protein
MNNSDYSALAGLIAQNRTKTLSIDATTDNLLEGSINLYFTSTRARSTFTAQTPLTYNSSTGVFSMPVATSSASGYLSNTDWTAFNGKANSFTGYTGSVSVRKGDDTGALTLTYSNGILTGVS